MFEWRTSGRFRYLVYPAWERAGIRHGFIGSSANFRDAVFAENSHDFCQIFEAQKLVVLNQVHGSEILSLPQPAARADGILIPLNSVGVGAFAIRAADCLALFIRSQAGLGLVHAGWRGLAAGIVERAVNALKADSVEVLCWPSAGSETYEVGSEVIDAIGNDAIYSTRAGKLLLNLAATAERKLRKIVPQANFVESGLCTISNSDFHSYRRDGENRGSNLAFLIT